MTFKQHSSYFDPFAIKRVLDFANGTILSDKDAKTVLSYYDWLHKEDGGLYNYKKLPYKAFAEMQQKNNSVAWIIRQIM